ncbi:hypothetical protein HDV00_002986 [Rhizophlyctis rosea]|nr:hypothetical protein HDV00_002986 [Rhizophlyctis rosea]
MRVSALFFFSISAVATAAPQGGVTVSDSAKSLLHAAPFARRQNGDCPGGAKVCGEYCIRNEYACCEPISRGGCPLKSQCAPPNICKTGSCTVPTHKCSDGKAVCCLVASAVCYNSNEPCLSRQDFIAQHPGVPIPGETTTTTTKTTATTTAMVPTTTTTVDATTKTTVDSTTTTAGSTTAATTTAEQTQNPTTDSSVPTKDPAYPGE